MTPTTLPTGQLAAITPHLEGAVIEGTTMDFTHASWKCVCGGTLQPVAEDRVNGAPVIYYRCMTTGRSWCHILPDDSWWADTERLTD